MSKITDIQTTLGVKADDVWGPKSQAALQAEIAQTIDTNDKIERIQGVLGVKVDGRWGQKSQAALNKAVSKFVATDYHASSFADPADVRAFKKCKAEPGNKTDVQCFRVGDNGIGQFGQITAQEHTPMVAVHKKDMIAKWGSVAGAAHREVEVTVNKRTFRARVEDRISAPGRIDLNPACAKLAGLQPPFVVPCTWRWV